MLQPFSLLTPLRCPSDSALSTSRLRRGWLALRPAFRGLFSCNTAPVAMCCTCTYGVQRWQRCQTHASIDEFYLVRRPQMPTSLLALHDAAMKSPHFSEPNPLEKRTADGPGMAADIPCSAARSCSTAQAAGRSRGRDFPRPATASRDAHNTSTICTWFPREAELDGGWAGRGSLFGVYQAVGIAEIAVA